MEQTKRGGYRPGSGRKPTGKLKVPITIYVEEKFIYPFGNRDNLKKEAYNFIVGYGKDEPTPIVAPAVEIKPVTPQKPNPAPLDYGDPFEPVTGLKTGKSEDWQDRILATTTVKELAVVMKTVKTTLLTVKEKQTLEAIAKEHSTNMYTD